MSKLLEQVGQRGSDPERIAHKVLTEPALVAEIIQGLQADAARVKFGCAKILRLVSERAPERVYPHFGVFVRLLEHENKLLQWEAIFVLSHLARVDTKDRFGGIFGKYFAPIPGPLMITAANVIGGAARIAVARPRWADRIAREVLKVARARYQTAECRNVAIGHAIEAFGQFHDLLQNKRPVVRFVMGQLKNTRNATRKKAERFLKKQTS
jgi:hypothetical protein